MYNITAKPKKFTTVNLPTDGDALLAPKYPKRKDLIHLCTNPHCRSRHKGEKLSLNTEKGVVVESVNHECVYCKHATYAGYRSQERKHKEREQA